MNKNKICKLYRIVYKQIPKCGTLIASGFVGGCAATLGREPLRNVPKLCCVGTKDSTTSGSGGALTLARRLLELTCNHLF